MLTPGLLLTSEVLQRLCVWEEEESGCPAVRLQGRVGQLLPVDCTARWKGWRQPGKCDGKLGWTGGTWLPRFGWHRIFLNRKHSEDVALAPCLSNGRMTQEGHSSHLLPPRPWHTGTTVIKGLGTQEQQCLNRERTNNFMFDFGDVRSDRPCSYQSCSFPWHHRRGGRSWKKLSWFRLQSPWVGLYVEG